MKVIENNQHFTDPDYLEIDVVSKKARFVWKKGENNRFLAFFQNWMAVASPFLGLFYLIELFSLPLFVGFAFVRQWVLFVLLFLFLVLFWVIGLGASLFFMLCRNTFGWNSILRKVSMPFSQKKVFTTKNVLLRKNRNGNLFFSVLILKQNGFFDYEATGDFSKFLFRIKWRCLKTKFWQQFIGMERRQAIFYFSAQPVFGELLVRVF